MRKSTKATAILVGILGSSTVITGIILFIQLNR